MRDTIWKKQNNTITAQKSKPTIQIYQPPGGRADINVTAALASNQQLNVYAKEFMMKHNNIHNNKMLSNQPMDSRSSCYLQHSKSSGNIQRYMKAQTPPQSQNQLLNYKYLDDHTTNRNGSSSIQHFISSSNANMLHVANHRVHFHVEPKLATSLITSIGMNKPGRLSKSHSYTSSTQYGLKRSKSFSNDSIVGFQTNTISSVASLGKFPIAIQDVLVRAIEGTYSRTISWIIWSCNKSSSLIKYNDALCYTLYIDPNVHNSRTLMELVRHILNRVVENRRYAEPAAKICMRIIEQEIKETFLESLLNTCQQWYQDHSKILLHDTPTTAEAASASCYHQFSGFMTFLNEMYCQLKRLQLQLRSQQEDSVPPGRVLLTLLCKCCHDCLQPSSITNSLAEVDSLFLILTSIGQDLHTELPIQLEHLLVSVRDAFLVIDNSITLFAVKKTLLQIIELHAAHWQLSAPALVYYYPGSSKS